MIPKLYFLSTVFLSTAIFLGAQKGNRNSAANSDEKEYLFPGTGFFVKNRKPYDEPEAKSWFKEAYELELKELFLLAKKKKTPRSTFIDGYEALKLANAAVKSLSTKRTVFLSK